MTTVPSFTLNTRAIIPAIGLGAWAGLSPEEQAKGKTWFLTALNAGYRHIDTAWIYGTEKSVGEAIRESGIPREEIFVTTKLPWHHTGRVAQSINESLKNAGLEYFDLYLLHWPQSVFYDHENNPLPTNPDGTVKVVDSPTFNEAWADMEKLLATGKVKAIGVNNFSVKTLEQLFKTAKVVPAVNQVELHLYLAQQDLLDYCKAKGILLAAYTPTGYDKVRNDPVILELAAKYKAWHVARGTPAVPKSENAQRQKDNITLSVLTAEDVARVSSLDRYERIMSKEDEQGKVWGWTYEQLGW